MKKKEDPFPSHIHPMLCTLFKESFDRKGWIFEIKWDGYRTIAQIQNKQVQIYSRNQLSFNHLFPQISHALTTLDIHSAIFDGELVVLDSSGKSQFQLLQNYSKSNKGDVLYYVFDLLYLNGQDLRNHPLVERKKILDNLITNKNKLIKFSDHIEEKGILLFKTVVANGLEGIIAKNSQSTYQMRRSKEWLKIKTTCRQEVVIGGFTEPKGSRQYFGSLVVGVYKKRKLYYVGKVGTGFTEESLATIYKQIKLLTQENAPFENSPKGLGKVFWLKPRLVCEVVFTEWTQDGKMRHPTFQGMRIDKEPGNVRLEKQKNRPL